MLKKLLRFSLALGALLAAGVGFLLWNTTPLLHRLKPQLEAMATEAVGQPVSLGELSLRILPSIAIEASGGAAGEGASVGPVALKAKLGPLLRGDLEVTELSLQQPKLHITRAKDGSIRIGQIPLGARPAANGPGAPEGTSAGDNGRRIALQIEQASLKGGEIVFVDEQAPHGVQEIRVSELDLSLDRITTASVGSFDLRASLFGSTPQNFRVSGHAERAATAGGPIPASGAVSLHWDGIALTTLGQLAEGYGGHLPPGAQIGGTAGLSIEAVSDDGGKLTVRVDATQAALDLGTAFRKPAGVALKLDSTLVPEGLGAKLPQTTLTAGASTVDLSGSVQPVAGQYAFTVQSTGIKLSEIAAMLPAAATFKLQGDTGVKLSVSRTGGAQPQELGGTVTLRDVGLSVPTGEQSALPVTDINGTIELSRDTVTVKPLTVTVAKQKLDAGAKIVSLTQPTVQLAVKSDSLSLEAIGAGVRPGGIAALNGAVLNGAQLTGTYSLPQQRGAAQLTFTSGPLSGLPLANSKVAVDLTLSPGGKPELITLQPSSLAVFGGTLGASGTLGQMKQLTLSIQGAKLDIAKLAAFGEVEGFTGTLSVINANVRADTGRVGDTLSGPVHLQALSGTIPGVNLLSQTIGGMKDVPLLGPMLLSLIPEKFRPMLQANSTAYDTVTIDATLAGAKTTIPSFVLEHQLYHVTGSGTLERGGALHFDAQMRFTPALVKDMMARNQKLKFLLDKDQNLVVPLVIRRNPGGPILVLPDVSDLAKRALAGSAKDEGKKALDKVAPGLGTAIDSLFH